MNEEKSRDAWTDGFEEGRKAMARSVVSRLRGSMPDEELSVLVGFDLSELLGEMQQDADDAGLSAAQRSRYDHAAVPGLRLVEPAFVRAVRLARHLTQPQLAAMLGVNARTVSEWETALVPVRMKRASYERLSAIASSSAVQTRSRSRYGQ